MEKISYIELSLRERQDWKVLRKEKKGFLNKHEHNIICKLL